MEARLPKCELNCLDLAYGGSGDIVVWALLLNDEDDHEMARMTDCLVTLIPPQRMLRRVDSHDSLEKASHVVGNGTSLYITGHCRFKEADTSYRPIAERTLGGFPVDDVIPILFNAVCSGVTYIEFWCCETACTYNSEQNNQGNGAKRKIVNFDFDLGIGTGRKIMANNSAEVSTLDYIACKLCNMLLTTPMYKGGDIYYNGTFCLTGLNGTGFLQSGKGMTNIVTFDQSAHLQTLSRINALEKLLETDKKSTQKSAQYKKRYDGSPPGDRLLNSDTQELTRLQLQFDAHINGRSCHFVVFQINMDNMRKARRERSKLKKLQSGSNGDSGDSGSPGSSGNNSNGGTGGDPRGGSGTGGGNAISVS